MPRPLIAAALILFATGAASASEGETAGTGGFRGRSGATQVKLVVVCAIPGPSANEQGGFAAELVARIKDAATQTKGYRLDEKRLREIAEQWSGQGPPERARSMEELLKSVPPKYHATIKKYFEELEHDAKKK